MCGVKGRRFYFNQFGLRNVNIVTDLPTKLNKACMDYQNNKNFSAFYLQMAAKTTSMDMKQNYVTRSL